MEYSLAREYAKVVDGIDGVTLAVVGLLELGRHPFIKNLLDE